MSVLSLKSLTPGTTGFPKITFGNILLLNRSAVPGAIRRVLFRKFPGGVDRIALSLADSLGWFVK